MAVEKINLLMKEREGVTTGAKTLSRLQGVMHVKEGVTLDKIKSSISTEMRRKTNAEMMTSFVLFRPLLITCIFSIKTVKVSGNEGVMRV